MRVKEWQGDVIFLHEVGPGAADRSYGIQVARRAGLPHVVIDRALEVLRLLEKSSSRRNLVDDLPLFSALPSPASPAGPAGEIAALLAQASPDDLTPRDALDLIYRTEADRARGFMIPTGAPGIGGIAKSSQVFDEAAARRLLDAVAAGRSGASGAAVRVELVEPCRSYSMPDGGKPNAG